MFITDALVNLSKLGIFKPLQCLDITQVPSKNMIQEISRNKVKICKGFTLPK